MIQTLEYKLSKLPLDLKKEAEIFIDYLIFKSKINKKNTKRESGFLKGKISMNDDFDEPLECFEEYMQ